MLTHSLDKRVVLVTGSSGLIGAHTVDRLAAEFRVGGMVIVFGLAVGPLGLVSVLLVMAQPLLIDAWCTLCLVSAVLSIVMIGPAMDEVLASLQFLKRVHNGNLPVWKVFCKGDAGLALSQL